MITLLLALLMFRQPEAIKTPPPIKESNEEFVRHTIEKIVKETKDPKELKERWENEIKNNQRLRQLVVSANKTLQGRAVKKTDKKDVAWQMLLRWAVGEYKLIQGILTIEADSCNMTIPQYINLWDQMQNDK